MARSVRQRLLNLSRQRQEDFQLTLIRYALERLLYRLSLSPHRGLFVLKGAMLFQVWSDQTRRPTRDVDFLGMGEPEEKNYYPIFQELCQSEVPDDGLVFDGTSLRIEPMKEDQQYPGLRVKLNARLETARIPVQVDIGFGDAITPSPVEVDYPTLLDFQAPRLSAYPRETVIAEKFQAMIALGIANSRMKDFFDVWLLSRQFSFQGTLLCRALAATFSRRQTPMPEGSPLALGEEFGGDDQKQRQWLAFVGKGRLNADGLTLPEVTEQLARFLLPPAHAIQRKQPFDQHWSAGGPWTLETSVPVGRDSAGTTSVYS